MAYLSGTVNHIWPPSADTQIADLFFILIVLKLSSPLLLCFEQCQCQERRPPSLWRTVPLLLTIRIILRYIASGQDQIEGEMGPDSAKEAEEDCH